MDRKYKRCSCETVKQFENCFKKWLSLEKWQPFKELEQFYKAYCIKYNLFPISQEVFRKRFKTITEIYQNNNLPSLDTLTVLVDEYYNIKSTKRRLDIRYGDGRSLEYSNTLREKAKTKTGTVDKIEYWLNKGFDLNTAERKRSEFYKNLNQKATEHNKLLFASDPESYRKRYKNTVYKNSYKYWLDSGLSIDEAKCVIQNIHKNSVQSLFNFILRYGEDLGIEKFNEMNSKRLSTRIKNHGSAFTGNRTSKASLKFLVKIYKKLRKHGIPRADIVWGIGKRKEFIKYDPKTDRNYAYDFVIKSKNIVIEYNDPFWHARNQDGWRNPHIKYDDSLKFDSVKREFIENCGYKVITVWSDDLPSVDSVINLIYEQTN